MGKVKKSILVRKYFQEEKIIQSVYTIIFGRNFIKRAGKNYG
tara:strand:+ start:739 stop:864 length:126 start_codon:yes stop_codon:yes gene_type:complete